MLLINQKTIFNLLDEGEEDDSDEDFEFTRENEKDFFVYQNFKLPKKTKLGKIFLNKIPYPKSKKIKNL